jgi:PAS domain S-box-containing protein
MENYASAPPAETYAIIAGIIAPGAWLNHQGHTRGDVVNLASRDGASPSAAHAAIDPRVELALRIEWTVLAGRYLTVLAVALLTLGGSAAITPGPAALGLCLVFMLHNVFVHWVLIGRRYEIFLTGINFALYLMEISLLVAMAGASDSALFVLYMLFIIAFNTYSRQRGGALLVTLVCCLSYGLLVYGEWTFGYAGADPGRIVTKFLALITCGWLVGSLNDFLSATEIALESRAGALASSEATLRMILNSADDPILVFDENELVTDANDHACAFLRLPREKLLGSRIRTHLFDDGNLSNQLAAMRSRGEYQGEAVAVRADGEDCNVEFRVHSFEHQDRRFYVSIWHDLTEMKNLQEATRLANSQLEAVNRELYHVNQLKTAFLANVSRRIHSPLSALLGFNDMLLDEELGPLSMEQREALRSCRRSAERILGLVDEVFRLDESGAPAAPAQAAPTAEHPTKV